MNTKIKVNKPEPIPRDVEMLTFREGENLRATIQALERGEYVWIDALYSDGIFLLKELHRYLEKKLPNKTFKEQQAYRTEYHRISNLVVLEVVDQKLTVGKSPSIGWLEKLYPEDNNFLLSFPQIQGMNSAWQVVRERRFYSCFTKQDSSVLWHLLSYTI